MRMPILNFMLLPALMLGALASPPSVNAEEPCCNITAIDARAQTVTARDTKTGRTFQFKVADARTLTALKVGQPVHADFTTMKVSLNPNGIEPCCNVVNLRAPATPTR